jgi:parvulin-like peptidyl-prolyl isomerase
MKLVGLASLLCLASSVGCTALATGPSWVGGGLAVSTPERIAEEEAQASRERARIASQPNQIGARHILIMHQASKSKPEFVVRTREEAKIRAQQCLDKLRAGAKFDAMVKEYTDEPGGAERNGDLGQFDRTQMVKQFADAAFGLRVGEISQVVESPFGFHVIQRTE